MALALALGIAWVLDTCFGEPRSAWHPVAWFGRALGGVSARLPTLPPTPAFVAGAAAWLLMVGAVAAAAWWLQRELLALPAWLGVPLLAVALKPSFAWRMLKDEVRAVEHALGAGLDAGRRQIAHVCSRDVSGLSIVEVRETAIETLSENLNDSLVAPLFWFTLLGLPGAWAWRATNTLDAMWGYRGRWEWAGKWAARADDVLAWLPARLAALLLWRPAIGFRALCEEARRTPSPNGGWPMAAMALRLGVRLGKPGVYRLNAPGAEADDVAVARSLRIAEQASVATFLLAGAVLLGSGGPWR
jgi:adenosylcobinamide-phosphate synthase